MPTMDGDRMCTNCLGFHPDYTGTRNSQTIWWKCPHAWGPGCCSRNADFAIRRASHNSNVRGPLAGTGRPPSAQRPPAQQQQAAHAQIMFTPAEYAMVMASRTDENPAWSQGNVTLPSTTPHGWEAPWDNAGYYNISMLHVVSDHAPAPPAPEPSTHWSHSLFGVDHYLVVRGFAQLLRAAIHIVLHRRHVCLNVIYTHAYIHDDV